MSRRLTVLSPHRDDAAFSLSLTLHEAVRAGCAVRVIVIVTRSSYAPFAAVDPGMSESVEAISALREREDEAFIARLRREGAVEVVTLERQDAPLRGDYPALSFLHSRPYDEGERAELEAVTAELERLTDSDVFFVPLGLGEHVDHRIARDAACRAWSDRRLAFYEELPYACVLQEEQITSHARAVAPGVGPRTLGRSSALDDKAASVGCYPSQVREPKAREMVAFASRYGGGERVWTRPGEPLWQESGDRARR